MLLLSLASMVRTMKELSMDLSCKDTLSLSLKLLQKKRLVRERKCWCDTNFTLDELFHISSSHVVRTSVTMANAGVAPFYYPLTLNAKAVDANSGSVISSKSIVVPIANQLDQIAFVYDFDLTVQTKTSVQFSIWLNSSHLVGNQTIVFAISNASASGFIQLPTFPIGPCTSSNIV